MIFILHLYHIYVLIMNVEPSSHPWNKFHLIVVYDFVPRLVSVSEGKDHIQHLDESFSEAGPSGSRWKVGS